MSRGQAVTFAPLGQRLTTQQAADLLGISRPTLIELLETGRIPFETPGRHRRIRLSDVLDYQAVRRGEQRQVLRDLTQDPQELRRTTTPATFTTLRFPRVVRSAPSPDVCRPARRLRAGSVGAV